MLKCLADHTAPERVCSHFWVMRLKDADPNLSDSNIFSCILSFQKVLTSSVSSSLSSMILILLSGSGSESSNSSSSSATQTAKPTGSFALKKITVLVMCWTEKNFVMHVDDMLYKSNWRSWLVGCSYVAMGPSLTWLNAGLQSRYFFVDMPPVNLGWCLFVRLLMEKRYTRIVDTVAVSQSSQIHSTQITGSTQA